MRSARAFSPVAAVALAAAGCADFDREDRVEDLRVLAVKTEPAEILYHPFYGFLAPADRPGPPFFPAMPSYAVDVEVFAFDPRGGDMAATAQLCPQGYGACLDFDPEAFVAGEPAEGQAELLAAWRPREVDVDNAGRTDDNPAGGIGGLSFRYELTPPVVDSLIPNTAEGAPIPSFFPELPRVVVDVVNRTAPSAGVKRETAYKRVPVGLDTAHPDLPREILDLFGEILGVRYCEAVIPDDEFVEGRTDCVEPRPPNENPELLGFDIDSDEDLELIADEGMRFSDVPDLGVSSLLSVPRGGALHLTPVFRPGDLEHYQVLGFEIETSELFVENRWEDYACSWYTTRGDVSYGLTSVQFDGRLGVTWQLPFDAASPGERDELFLVVRDQRGGTATARVVVEVR